MTARHDMDLALVDLAAKGERPRCGWPDIGPWFTSDDHEDRARAARRCAGCPVLELCAAVAEEEQPCHGVWAGKDYSRHPAKRNRPTEEKST